MSDSGLTQVLRRAAQEPELRRQLVSDLEGTLRKEGLLLASAELRLIRELDIASWSLKAVNERLSQEGMDMISPY